MKSRKIFDPDIENDWRMNACLNFNSDMSWGYINGYKRAADLLIENVRGRRSDLDSMVYPICFLYRHYIEIQLKEILYLYGQLHDLEEVGNFLSKPRHSLKEIWHKFKELYKTEIAGIERVDAFIDELDSFDKSGTAFRYHREMKGERVSIRHRADDKPVAYCALDILHSEMQEVQAWLDAIDTALSVEMDHKSEMLAAVGGY